MRNFTRFISILLVSVLMLISSGVSEMIEDAVIDEFEDTQIAEVIVDTVEDAAEIMDTPDIEDAEITDAEEKAAVPGSGEFGRGLRWSLNSTGTLTISCTGSTGQTGDYFLSSYMTGSHVPWYDQRENIRTITVGKGVTYLGRYVFAGCSNLRSVTLSEGVEELGQRVFEASSLTSIVLPATVKKIGDYAFSEGVKSISFCGTRPQFTGVALTLLGNITCYYPTRYASTWTSSAFPTFSSTSITWKTWTPSVGGAAINISQLTYSQAYTTTVYTGSALCPSVTLVNGGTTLVKDVDYTVSYLSNTNPGTAQIVISGIGKYTGTRKSTFTITKANNTIRCADISLLYSKKTALSAQLEASCLGGAALSYRSNNSKIKVDATGKLTITKGYIGSAVITVTAASTSCYNKTEKTVSVLTHPSKYTVKYNANGGKKIKKTVKVAYNAAIGKLPTPTRTGYNFMGWYYGGNRIITSTPINFAATTVTLKASWEKKNYTVTFNANGGSVNPSTRTVAYNTAVGTLPSASRSGYTLKGWYTKKSGGSKISAKTKIKGNKTFYAQWKKNKPSGGYTGPGACSACSGMGYTKCYTCGGSGIYYWSMQGYKRCHHCGGSGRLTCSYCRGTGRR